MNQARFFITDYHKNLVGHVFSMKSDFIIFTLGKRKLDTMFFIWLFTL